MQCSRRFRVTGSHWMAKDNRSGTTTRATRASQSTTPLNERCTNIAPGTGRSSSSRTASRTSSQTDNEDTRQCTDQSSHVGYRAKGRNRRTSRTTDERSSLSGYHDNHHHSANSTTGYGTNGVGSRNHSAARAYCWTSWSSDQSTNQAAAPLSSNATSSLNKNQAASRAGSTSSTSRGNQRSHGGHDQACETFGVFDGNKGATADRRSRPEN